MILTINYSDLQNIKEQILNEKKLEDKKIYMFIRDFKDTLNNMYKKKLVADKSKTDYEYELMTFAKEMLNKTNKTYRALEKEFGGTVLNGISTGLNDIRLIL